MVSRPVLLSSKSSFGQNPALQIVFKLFSPWTQQKQLGLMLLPLKIDNF